MLEMNSGLVALRCNLPDDEKDLSVALLTANGYMTEPLWFDLVAWQV